MVTSATDVFVSYKAEDRARLKPLVDALEAEGFTVWWDAHIGGGTNWHEDIEQHLDAAKCVIVAWSKRSVGHDGHFVRDEARRAQRRDVYVPVCLDQVEPPLGFGEIQALQLKGWKGDRSDPRFRAVVNAVRTRLSGEKPSGAHVHLHQPRVSRRAAIAGGAGIAAVAAVGGGWFLLKPTATNAKRIAVLPFANLSHDEDQAYFAEGVAEELRDALSRIGLQVIGRASSDAVKDMDTKAAAAKLGVGNILTGSVRRSPKMVRISAQLVGGSDGVEHWAQSYDRAPGDEIKIQTDIATKVAEALSVALGQAGAAALKLGGTSDAAAQDLYLRARTLANTASSESSIREGIGLLDAAIARDPNYADAYRLKGGLLDKLIGFASGAGDASDKLGQAEAAARRAIAIAPKLGTNYVVLALIELDRFDFRTALQHVRRGLALTPNNATVLSTASFFRQMFGTPSKALQLVDALIALDPLKAINYFRRADVLFTLRNYPQSIVAARKALELAPQLSDEYARIAACLMLMNRPTEAKAEYAKAPPDDPLRLTGEAMLAARAGDRAGAEQIVSHMRGLFGAAMSYQYAQVFAQARDPNRAFAELDNALQARDPGLVELKVDILLDPIRRDERYAALVRRLNLPTWS